MDSTNAFRLVLPHHQSLKLNDIRNPLLREVLDTTEILSYGRRLWHTSHDRIRFLLELPASRRWLETTLSAEHTGGEEVTLITAEVIALPHRLTARELEVLTLVAAGHSNPAIAEMLFTSPRTVSTQVETIRAKLGAISRTAAGVQAFQNSWLKLPLPVPPEMLGTLSIAGLMSEHIEHLPASAMAVAAASSPKLPSPIRLGLAYAAKGPASADGMQSLRGALLAVDQINARGGIRGRAIEPVQLDAGIYTGAGVRSTFAELREREVDAVLMSYVFDEQAAFESAAELGVPVLHTMTSKRHLETVRMNPRKFRALFQCVPPETNYGPGLARFLSIVEETGIDGGSRTVRFVETAADSGQIADAGTLRLLEERGWRTAGVEVLEPDPGAMERLVGRILEDPPTVLVVTEFLPSTLAALLTMLRAAKCPSVIYTIYAPSIPEFATEMGDAAEGLVWATVSSTYSDPYGQQFREAYIERYSESPGLSQAGLAYDMVHVISSAWQQSIDPSDISGTVEALRSTRYRGVNGSYNFTLGRQSTIAYPEETDDPSLGNAQLIFQVQGGEHRCISPAPYSDAEFRWPSAL